ncbi:hypothetical protein FOT53_09440 [Citrobacter freundii]|nr:hypothetical protein [Citrobacter freundii]
MKGRFLFTSQISTAHYTSFIQSKKNYLLFFSSVGFAFYGFWITHKYIKKTIRSAIITLNESWLPILLRLYAL